MTRAAGSTAVFRARVVGAMSGALLATSGLVATAASAASLALAVQVSGSASAPRGSAADGNSRAPFAGPPVAPGRLAAQRGGTSGGEAQLTGSVSDAQATHVTTGSNTLTSGAFAGASGVATVIQNSGNNVLIQNSTIVNVQLK